MKKSARLISFILTAVLAATLVSCSRETESTPVDPADFRITAYVLGSSCSDISSFDSSHIAQLTDIILFGVATFDEAGNISLTADFNSSLQNLRSVMKTDGSQRLYLNLLGPGNQSDSDDWYDQMADLAQRHTNAFESGNLEKSIKTVLDKYDFDGVFFDYEFPIKGKFWKPYNKFIVSLDETLGDEYKIGMSMVDWDLKQSKEAMDATDMFELMSYDNWDDNGNHATYELAVQNVEKLVKKGYDKSKIDLGVPFYARPTTHDSYWYDYKGYYDKIDENGLYDDSAETGLTFSFNTCDLIRQKTDFALQNGLGGMMIWHYSCDVPAGNDKSLFDVMTESVENAKAN